MDVATCTARNLVRFPSCFKYSFVAICVAVHTIKNAASVQVVICQRAFTSLIKKGALIIVVYDMPRSISWT